MTADIT
nr:unnamed protein product [Callosobruchus chinensis]